MTFVNIGKVINKRFKQGPLTKQVTAALVCGEFNKLILKIWGKKMENQAQAIYLKNKQLSIACLSPIIAQEIKMREGQLVEKINQKIGQKVVERLKLLI